MHSWENAFGQVHRTKGNLKVQGFSEASNFGGIAVEHRIFALCRELDLSGNQLSELGSGLSVMPSLQLLLLDHNCLKVLPDSLGNCPALVKLDISNNLLQCLPQSLGHLKRIQRINCSNNSLERVPPSMGALPLKEFDLRWPLRPS